jgi:hypothetical protein
MLVKNTYGISYVLSPRVSDYKKLNQFGGSSLERKKLEKRRLGEPGTVREEIKIKKRRTNEGKPARLRSLSQRSKGKIRGKLISFIRLNERLTFVTLTFWNSVKDNVAIKILGSFLKNTTKQSDDFQYLWVAEKQAKNQVYKDNIHFHIVTNLSHWDIKKWWEYWLEVQGRYGIVPRDSTYKPSSAFDVKRIKSNNIKGLVKYLTKYITKNNGKFDCQTWNCSRKVSWLYTSFYSDEQFIEELKRLEASGELGGKVQVFAKEYCNVNLIPLNDVTSRFYDKIDDRNRTIWNGSKDGKEVAYVA